MRRCCSSAPVSVSLHSPRELGWNENDSHVLLMITRILKSIWYRMNNFNNSKPTRLSKVSRSLPCPLPLGNDKNWNAQVYFTWVIRDFGSAEWFHSLLHAIEEQDMQNRIEINIYLTAKIKDDDMTNIFVQDVGADKDAITSLRAPTHFGRPNWDRVFSSIAEKNTDTDVGVFFCGPAVLSRQLHQMSNKYSTPKGTRFFFGKGASEALCCVLHSLMDFFSFQLDVHRKLLGFYLFFYV